MDDVLVPLSVKFHFQQLVKIQNKDKVAAELTLKKKSLVATHFRPLLNASQSAFIPPLQFA